MGDFPDPDEEYELMYADEFELMREDENVTDEPNQIRKKSLPAKRSLDFSSPISSKTPNSQKAKHVQSSMPVATNQVVDNLDNDILTPSLQPLEEIITPVNVSINKRTAEELFGDINDIDFDNYELPSKRQKTEEENDLDMIHKIIEGRKLRQMLVEPSNGVQVNSKPDYNIKDNISLDIPRWAFVPVTNSNGERMYVKLESEDAWDSSLDTDKEQLSLQPAYAKAWEEARKILEAKEQQNERPLSQPDVTSVEVNADLWVDKYKPSSYVDLLSEEPVNRALLHWLHLWDKVVFKKEVKMKEPQQRSSFSKRTGQFQLTNKWKGKKESEPEMDEDGRPHHKVALLCGPPGVGKTTLAHLLAKLAGYRSCLKLTNKWKGKNENAPEMDRDGRPHHKVALLSGPPGVGKTTLAHLLAKLAGYRPVELNASDERSTEAFRTALHNATLMRSVLDAEKRPNCLILDEIDGAPIQTVELLVKWCTASSGKKEEVKKKGKTQPLRRPVIAICNDLYATSLRPLRPISIIVRVGSVSTARLASRLSAVAGRELVRVHSRALAALAARAAGDIRAALTVMSFLKARSSSQISVEDVENVSIGTKDCSKSMMDALQAIFTLNDRDPAAITKVVQGAGEYDRLAEGIFENYLSARVDSRLLVACEISEWLRMYDAVQSWTLQHQNYSLYSLLPICLCACHRVLAARQPQKVKFPFMGQETSRKRAELDSIVGSVWRGRSPLVTASRAALRTDVLPMLPYLLSPNLRSANVQLCSENERKSLRTCAGAMCEYGLEYSQQRTQDGLYAFVLEPDIYKVAFFGNEERSRPPPAVRQAIAREQQLEIIRRNDDMANRMSGKANSNDSKAKIEDKTNKPGDAKETRLPNHLQRLKPKALDKSTSQVHKDFFGRIVPITQSQIADAVPDVIKSSSVFYQYQEGYNNAVRRNVRLRDLL